MTADEARDLVGKGGVTLGRETTTVWNEGTGLLTSLASVRWSGAVQSVSTGPAILLVRDNGEPVLLPVEGTEVVEG